MNTGFVLVRSCQRQAYRKKAALPHYATGFDRAAMGLDDPAHDRQPETGAARVAAAPGIHPVEAVEDVRQVLRWDANAGISHGQTADGWRRKAGRRRWR